MHHFPTSLCARGEECYSLMCLLFLHYFPMTNIHIHCNKITLFYVNVLNHIITLRYGEVEWASDLVQFLV